MKTIKSALLGSKSLIDTNNEILLLQLKEILKEHRERIIIRLLSDLPTYLDYKFSVKADKQLIETIKDRLLDLKKSNADLDKYNAIVQQLLTKSVTHLTNEPFFREIDEYLGQYVVSERLKLV
jgi:hypothetical protein